MTETVALRAPAPRPGLRPGPAPRVSVLVPVFNAAHTVGEALESALTQSPSPHEVIVSDDGSVDDLRTALRPFVHRIHLVSGPNGGLATARNRAAAAATGDLLALLDADDVWLPGRVGALTAAAVERPDLAVLTTDAVETRDGARSPGTYYDHRHFEVERQEVAILREQFIFGAGAVRTADFERVGGYRPGTRYAEDWDLWLRLLLSGRRAGLVQEPLYEYRRHEGSLTDRKVDLGLGVLDVLGRARSFPLTHDQEAQLVSTQQQWRETVARTARRTRDPRARRLAARAALGSGAGVRSRARFAAFVLATRPPPSRTSR